MVFISRRGGWHVEVFRAVTLFVPLPFFSPLALVYLNNQRSSTVSMQAIELYTFCEAIRPRSPGPSSWLNLSGEAHKEDLRGVITRVKRVFT